MRFIYQHEVDEIDWGRRYALVRWARAVGSADNYFELS